jgi:hypothetical protein
VITPLINRPEVGRTFGKASSPKRLTNCSATCFCLMFVLVAGCNSKKEQQMPAGSASQAEPATTATSAPDVSIFDAAGNGNVDAIKQHIAAGTDIDQKQPITGNTPLNIACSMGQTEVAMALIEADAAIEAKGNEQTTPLFNAAFLCHTKTVQLLLEHDANAHTTDKNGTPLVDVMAAPWEAVAGIYQLVYSLIGVEFDAEEKRTTRPVILKMLKEHIAKETNGKSAMTPNRTAAEIAALSAATCHQSRRLTGPATTTTCVAGDSIPPRTCFRRTTLRRLRTASGERLGAGAAASAFVCSAVPSVWPPEAGASLVSGAVA